MFISVLVQSTTNLTQRNIADSWASVSRNEFYWFSTLSNVRPLWTYQL